MQQQQLSKIKSAKDSISKVTSLFKQAQLGGQDLGPDEVKELATETVQVLGQVAETLTDIAEGVPSTEPAGVESEEPSIGSPPSIGDGENDDEEPPVRMGQDEGEDEKDKIQMAKIATLEKQIATMERNSQVKEIATKYASLWPAKQQSAKYASIMSSKEDVRILEARLKEATNNFSGKSKVATSEPTDFRNFKIFEDKGNQKSASMRQEGQEPISLVNV